MRVHLRFDTIIEEYKTYILDSLLKIAVSTSIISSGGVRDLKSCYW